MTIIIVLMNFRHPLIKEILSILFISVILGVSAQAIIPNGIGIKTEITFVGEDDSQVAIPAVTINPEGDENATSGITLKDALAAHESKAALFIDARDPEEFALGHIMGAINLPAHAFMDSINYLESLDLNSLIITYCDGEDCNASIDLASDLIMMGFTRVNFFFGGWQEWQAAEFPVEVTP